MRIRQSLLQPYICQAETRVSWKGQWLGAGVQDCGAIPGQGLLLTAERLDLGDVKEEIVVGKACGGKPGSHGSKVILLSHA